MDTSRLQSCNWLLVGVALKGMVLVCVSLVSTAALTQAPVSPTIINGEAQNDLSGVAISFSAPMADGKLRMLIGSSGTYSEANSPGYAKVYEMDPTTNSWSQVGGIIRGSMTTVPAGKGYERFGMSVSISSNGDWMAVGAPSAWGGGVYVSGVVRIYKYESSNWVQVGSDILGGVTSDTAGAVVSLSHDGTRVAIGTRTMVKVYELHVQHDTNSWEQLGQAVVGGKNEYMSLRMALSGDGQRFVAATTSGAGMIFPGNFRVYTLNASTLWEQVGQTVGNQHVDDTFGSAVSITHDGHRIICGARTKQDTGQALVFDYDADGDSWVQFGSALSGVDGAHKFGCSASVSSLGSRVAIGACGISTYASVYEWNLVVGDWEQVERIEFGGTSGVVSISGNGEWVAVSMPEFNSNVGQTRVFKVAEPTPPSPPAPTQAAPTSSPTPMPMPSPAPRFSKWEQVNPGTILGESAQDYFGDAIAVSNPMPNGMVRVVIGAPGEYHSEGETHPGYVKVYDVNPTTNVWTAAGDTLVGHKQTGLDRGWNGKVSGLNEQFGYSVAVSANGRYVAVGAYRSAHVIHYGGRVDVFELNTSTLTWAQRGTPVYGNIEFDTLGASVSLSSNGDRLMVGGYLSYSNQAGMVRIYYFETKSNRWSRVATVYGRSNTARIGVYAAMSSNGKRFVHGAPFGQATLPAGTARVFEAKATNEAKTFVQIDDNSLLGNDGYIAGVSTAITRNGSRIVVGERHESNGFGRVQVYDLVLHDHGDNFTWQRVGRALSGSQWFGDSVSISSDGRRLVIGAPGANIQWNSQGTQLGYVQVYEWSPALADWTQVGSDIIATARGDASGQKVAMSGDGNWIVVGSPYFDDPSVGIDVGYARVFRSIPWPCNIRLQNCSTTHPLSTSTSPFLSPSASPTQPPLTPSTQTLSPTTAHVSQSTTTASQSPTSTTTPTASPTPTVTSVSPTQAPTPNSLQTQPPSTTVRTPTSTTPPARVSNAPTASTASTTTPSLSSSGSPTMFPTDDPEHKGESSSAALLQVLTATGITIAFVSVPIIGVVCFALKRKYRALDSVNWSHDRHKVVKNPAFASSAASEC
eukprot:m.200818 g.200818  ORF g.200818 m.200818 type:complete len:1087 (-) comp32775_c2_seq6:198-3458(-)